MFAKFFKPRWQHNKAAVRIKAVSHLSPDNSDDQQVLAQLARRDQSAEVRLAAVTKLATPALLSEIISHDADPDIRRKAADRICKIILDPAYTQSQQTECMQYLKDDNMLAHIALNCKNQELQQQALSNITDQHCLMTLTISGNNTHLRQLAAHQLELPELLEQAEKAIKGRDKSVFRIIRTKQNQLQEQLRQQQTTLQRKEELLGSIEHLSQADFFPLYAAKLDALQQQWEKLSEATSTSELDQQYQACISQCNSTLDSEKLRLASIEEALQQQQNCKLQQDALLLLMNNTVQRCEKLLNGGNFSKADIEAEQQAWLNIQSEWQLLEQPSEQNQSAKQLVKQYNKYIEAAHAWQLYSESPISLADPALIADNSAQLQKQIKLSDKTIATINWPSVLTKPEQLNELLSYREQLKKLLLNISRQQQSSSDDLDKLLCQLEQNLANGEVKIAISVEQKANAQLSEMNGSTPKSLIQRYKSLHAKLAELKGWQGYAIIAKKEQLCESMEALSGIQTKPPVLAKQIHKLQQQWKELDANDPVHSHDLWQRFKKASDKAYSPCENYFKEQKQQREQNLAKRTQLVSELSGYLETIDWDSVDWAQIELLNRSAKHEWKSYAPVDRTPGRQVQSEFNSLLKLMDGKIKGQREQVAILKKQLLEQASLLSQSENLAQAATEVKRLQQQWKQAGNSFHSTERTLWPEFRKACNQVFELLNQEKQAISSQTQSDENQHDIEALFDSSGYQALFRRINLCDELESMLLDGSLDQLAMDEFLNAWNNEEAADKSFALLIEKRFDLLLELVAGRIEMDQLLQETEQSLRQLCIRLEIMLGHDSPEQDQALRMEYQMDRLQKALSQRSHGSSAEDLKKLELEWQCQPFTLQHEALQIRFYCHLQQA
ncbi:DUF349 domain-containing protein [Amphritea balenae]|uniref:DUF349 domain-containing protein n=1 Tax=Amphritea balenae TaxID=452629 RepID=A0A3P1SSC3_9GAMM|nr:DUF349 domain-containing protein [Amphritea balenae]RRD00082.1 DUF349 domain-containing protein [Amphritea balenae]GGK76445.1 hypothetical protein GCM10007941_28260 [Amphritea balenae]